MILSKLQFSSLFIVLFLTIFTGCQSNNATDQQDKISFEISADSVNKKIIQNESIKLVDVRTPEEYKEKHISNSLLLTLDTIEDEISSSGLNKNDEIILYCRSGGRSAEAYQLFTKLGYTNVKSIAGGINKWGSLGKKVCIGLDNTC